MRRLVFLLPIAIVAVLVALFWIGLDPKRDRLLSIGALKVYQGRIDLGRTFSSRVRAPMASPPANILIHGIGGDAQLDAAPAEEVLPGFAGFAGPDIAVAYHAWFDREVLRRAMAGWQSPAVRVIRVIRGPFLCVAALFHLPFEKSESPRRSSFQTWDAQTQTLT